MSLRPGRSRSGRRRIEADKLDTRPRAVRQRRRTHTRNNGLKVPRAATSARTGTLHDLLKLSEPPRIKRKGEEQNKQKIKNKKPGPVMKTKTKERRKNQASPLVLHPLVLVMHRVQIQNQQEMKKNLPQLTAAAQRRTAMRKTSYQRQQLIMKLFILRHPSRVHHWTSKGFQQTKMRQYCSGFRIVFSSCTTRRYARRSWRLFWTLPSPLLQPRHPP
mmetsp:Transcript_27111/g.68404  ORF Transcript_27111/g.68404 Transcript_27111/m.68404 type:complete len:217 (-) Transcript_27111:907-1557(-)